MILTHFALFSFLGGASSNAHNLKPSPFYGSIVPPRIYGIVAGGRMPALRDFPSMDADGQTEVLWVDWGLDLSPGVTLAPNATPDVTVTVTQGKDDNPQSHVLTTPYVGTVPTQDKGTGLTNAAVLFEFGELIGGVKYLIEVTCLRSDGTTASAWGHIQGVTPT